MVYPITWGLLSALLQQLSSAWVEGPKILPSKRHTNQHHCHVNSVLCSHISRAHRATGCHAGIVNAWGLLWGLTLRGGGLPH
jgi:hypothetical protein